MSKANEQRVAAELTAALGLSLSARGFYLTGRECSDGQALLSSGWRVAVEVETSQTHPDTNVSKYWPWLEERSEKRVLLVQAYFSGSREVNGSRGRLASWLGARLERELPGRFLYRRIVDGDPAKLEEIRVLIRSLDGESGPKASTEL